MAEEIENIIQKVNIIADEKYIIGETQFTVQHTKQNEDRRFLTEQLAEHIYFGFYINGNTEEFVLRHIEAPPIGERNDFIDQAVLSIESNKKIDPYWEIIEDYGNGTLAVQKNKNIKTVYPQEYQPAKDYNRYSRSRFVHLNHITYDRSAQPIFFNIYSDEYLDGSGYLVRFYFNIEGTRVQPFAEHLTRLFNQYKIPFSLKCLNHLDLYSQRVDSCVLYLKQSHTKVASEILKLLYPEIKSLLKKRTPLFTKRLGPGIAFAEDPGNGISFGAHRCELIAEYIVSTNTSGKSHSRKRLMTFLESNGLHVDKLYSNSIHNYEYLTHVVD